MIEFVHVLACFLCCARKPSPARVALVLFLLMASLSFAHPPSLTFTSNLSSLAFIRMLSSLHYDLTADEELSRLALRAVLALIPRLSLVSLCSFHANEMSCIIKLFSLGFYLHSINLLPFCSAIEQRPEQKLCILFASSCSPQRLPS